MKYITHEALTFSQTLTPEERAEIAKELAWLETDLVRRRAKAEKWRQRAERCARQPELFDPDLITATYAWFERTQQWLETGEALRRRLWAVLATQPEHQPAIHAEN